MKKKLHLFKNLIKALQNNCKSALNFDKIPDRIINVVYQADIKVVCKWFGPFAITALRNLWFSTQTELNLPDPVWQDNIRLNLLKSILCISIDFLETICYDGWLHHLCRSGNSKNIIKGHLFSHIFEGNLLKRFFLASWFYS